jgi:hypothetical protein
MKNNKETKEIKGTKETTKEIKETKEIKADKLSKIILGGKTEQNLNQNQEAFCQLFVKSDKEFFGNGVQCYLEVYDIDTKQKSRYKTACSAASRLLNNVKVIARINQLLEE